MSLFARSVDTVQTVDWNAVYAEQLPKIYNYFRYRVGDGPVAEDLTAATFEKAWRKRNRFDRDLGAFSTWLFTIARNTATDYFRRRRPLVPLEKIFDPPDQKMGVESTVQRRQDFARLSTLLVDLSDRERELISMKYGAELTNRRIAEVTGLSETHVGTILYRTVRKLRDRWDDAEEF